MSDAPMSDQLQDAPRSYVTIGRSYTGNVWYRVQVLVGASDAELRDALEKAIAIARAVEEHEL